MVVARGVVTVSCGLGCEMCARSRNHHEHLSELPHNWKGRPGVTPHFSWVWAAVSGTPPAETLSDQDRHCMLAHWITLQPIPSTVVVGTR